MYYDDSNTTDDSTSTFSFTEIGPSQLILLFLLLLVLSIPVSLMGREMGREAAAMDTIPVLGAAALQSNPPGRTVFVEGLVSPSNRIMHRDWVAYIRQDEEYDDTSEKREWAVTESVLPPLLLSTTSGLVQIEAPEGGNGYRLENLARWSMDGPSRRYNGLKANNQVVALGQIQVGSRGLYLDAEMIARGTHNEYVARQQSTARFMSLISIPMFIIGLLGLAGALIWVLYTSRDSNN